jgi:hypothetical protein
VLWEPTVRARLAKLECVLARRDWSDPGPSRKRGEVGLFKRDPASFPRIRSLDPAGFSVLLVVETTLATAWPRTLRLPMSATQSAPIRGLRSSWRVCRCSSRQGTRLPSRDGFLCVHLPVHGPRRELLQATGVPPPAPVVGSSVRLKLAEALRQAVAVWMVRSPMGKSDGATGQCLQTLLQHRAIVHG